MEFQTTQAQTKTNAQKSADTPPRASAGTKRSEHEKKIVTFMIAIYCKKKHNNPAAFSGAFCNECAELAEYARQRSEACPFMENKTFCSNCTVHCYNDTMRQRIKRVMKFSGPRMLLFHPILATIHLGAVIGGKLRAKKSTV